MRILSGIQPSGEPHIGNFFGAMRQHVELQAKGEAIYFIADYHSMTSIRDAGERRRFTHELALDYLACGIDPARAILYRQSDLPEVTELAWILSTVTPMGLLERAHSFKDKVAQGLAVHHGLFAYPVLMAADILIYNADIVPVGQDQKQHLEMTRDIAGSFNHSYREVFKLPEPMILENVAVVPGTDGRKMSKSYDNTIRMFAPQGEIKKAVMGIVTDSTPVDQPKDTDGRAVPALVAIREGRRTRGALRTRAGRRPRLRRGQERPARAAARVLRAAARTARTMGIARRRRRGRARRRRASRPRNRTANPRRGARRRGARRPALIHAPRGVTGIEFVPLLVWALARRRHGRHAGARR